MALHKRAPTRQRGPRILQSTIRIQVTFSFPSPFVQDALLDFLTTALCPPVLQALAFCPPLAHDTREMSLDEHDSEVHIRGSHSE
jgi:hypothetical protein